jgi:integrase
MPRQPKGYWDGRSGRYYARLGAVSSETGKCRAVMLRHEDGRPIAKGEQRAVALAVQRLLAAIERGERERASPTVATLIADFLEWHHARGSRPRTIGTHRWHLTKFARFEGYDRRTAASITLADLTRWRKAMVAAGWQTGTLRGGYASILACWHWASRPVEDREPERIFAENPFDGLSRPRKGKGRKLVLPRATIERLIAIAEERTERPVEGRAHRCKKAAVEREREGNRLRCLALRLMAETGCRPGEAAALRWEWVMEAERAVVIPAEFTKTPGKAEDRILGLSPDLAGRLAELRASGRSHRTWVFATAGDPRERPPAPKRLAVWFGGVKADAAKGEPPIVLPAEATLYTLRHSLVSQARAGGIDLRELAPAMGHSAAVSEATYAHAQVVEIRELMDRAREAIARAG